MKIPPYVVDLELLSADERAAVEAMPEADLEAVRDLVALLEQLPHAHVRAWLATVMLQLLGSERSRESICAALNLYERGNG